MSDRQDQLQYKDMVVHCKRQPYDVYVGRPSRGAPPGDLCQWGNPFNMKNQTQEERNRVVHEYRCWLVSQPDLVAKAQSELKGKVLACWCSPKLCHGHVLAEIANSPQYAGKQGKKVLPKEANTWTLEEEDFPTLGATATKKVQAVAKKTKPVPAQSNKKVSTNAKNGYKQRRRRKTANKTTTNEVAA
ncbi:unnamed protein product [Cylindrotheca closterium]|uniref:DUF4326 domain-containing protein n=1 Tax=Cylindrotheca closterium TaxID=2856 RepID=A0AAD2PX45_9STRA|nr:unnamed protein product [Cylindrotheca closterium]